MKKSFQMNFRATATYRAVRRGIVPQVPAGLAACLAACLPDHPPAEQLPTALAGCLPARALYSFQLYM